MKCEVQGKLIIGITVEVDAKDEDDAIDKAGEIVESIKQGRSDVLLLSPEHDRMQLAWSGYAENFEFIEVTGLDAEV